MKIRLTDGSGTIELRYLVEDVDRYGKARIYFRRKGQRKVPLRAPVGSTEFLQEYRDALAGKIKTKADAKRVPAPTGSLRALIEQYCEKSAEFKMLDERTQYVRRGIHALSRRPTLIPRQSDRCHTLQHLPKPSEPFAIARRKHRSRRMPG